MLYKEIASPSDLISIIECFWLLEHDYRSPLHTHEHLWAHGHSELIFSFGQRYYQKTKTGKTFLPKDFVIGPFKNKLMLFSDGFTGFVAVRFKPWGLFPFSAKPIPALVGNIAPAEDVFGDEINCLLIQLRPVSASCNISGAVARSLVVDSGRRAAHLANTVLEIGVRRKAIGHRNRWLAVPNRFVPPRTSPLDKDPEWKMQAKSPEISGCPGWPGMESPVPFRTDRRTASFVAISPAGPGSTFFCT